MIGNNDRKSVDEKERKMVSDNEGKVGGEREERKMIGEYDRESERKKK